jgi:presenilin-like A22 family membrane protease
MNFIFKKSIFKLTIALIYILAIVFKIVSFILIFQKPTWKKSHTKDGLSRAKTNTKLGILWNFFNQGNLTSAVFYLFILFALFFYSAQTIHVGSFLYSIF